MYKGTPEPTGPPPPGSTASHLWARSPRRDNTTTRQMISFGLVGMINVCFGYSLYAVSYLLGLRPWLALLFATVLGVIFNFFTTGRIVFGERALALLPKFLLAYAGIYLTNTLLLH